MSQLKIQEVFEAPGRAPAGLAWDGSYIWLNDYQSGQLFQLDPKNGQVISTLLCSGVVSGLAFDGQHLWQSRLDENWLQRVNATNRDFEQTIQVEGYTRLTDLAWSGDQLWAIAQQANRLLAIDPESGQIIHEWLIPSATTSLSFHRDFFWLTYASPMRFNPDIEGFEWSGPERNYFLATFDSSVGKITSHISLEFLPMGNVWQNDRLWLTHPAQARLYSCEIG